MSDPVGRPGRRAQTAPSGGRRLDVTTVLAVVVPLLAVLALLVVPSQAPGGQLAGDDPGASRAPERTALTRATVTCPGTDADVQVATTGDEAGEVEVRRGDDVAEVEVRPGSVTSAPAARDDAGDTGDTGDAGDEGDEGDAGADGPLPAEVGAGGALAPGLVVGRSAAEAVAAPAAPECREPRPDQWFTGVGASPRHSSVLELTNPDAGPAVADVVVHGPDGVVDAPSLRGVAVPGQGTVRVDLAREVPRRGTLALHVTTTRGRVGAAVLDSFDDLGAGASGSDWLASQAEPATEVTLLGLPGDDTRRELALASASDDQARVEVSLVTPDSVFVPDDAPEVDVAPQGTARVDLAGLLDGQDLDDVVGVRVESTRPVTASVRSVVEGDLAVSAAGEELREGTAAVLPPGATRLLVAATGGRGSVVATAEDAAGRALGTPEEREGLRADLAEGGAAVLDLPEGTRLLQLRLRGTAAVAAVEVRGPGGGGGAAVVRLHELETTGLVGDVRPALP